MNPNHKKLASQLRDLPEWVDVRGMLLSRPCEVIQQKDHPTDYVVWSLHSELICVVGAPPAEDILAAVSEFNSDVKIFSSEENIGSILPGWLSEMTIIHQFPETTQVRKSDMKVRLVDKDEVASIREEDPELADRLLREMDFSPVAATFDVSHLCADKQFAKKSGNCYIQRFYINQENYMIEPNPLKRFSQLYEQILKSDLPEPSAVTLATVTPDGKPAARIVLLKGFDERGFVIYTNLESRKAIELYSNPHAALCFYWEPIQHQIRVEGKVEQIPAAAADAYFAERPRGSQIGAWASKQSSLLRDPGELETRFHEYEKKFADKEVPRPEFWSGFRLRPHLIEFWERRENRLHKRTVYSLEKDKWQIRFLYP